MRFSLSEHEGKISVLEPLRGARRAARRLAAHHRRARPDRGHLILAAACDNGDVLDEEAIRRLWSCPAARADQLAHRTDRDARRHHRTAAQAAIAQEVAERNLAFFEAETDKLDGWADDLKAGLEREIKELDRQIREARQAAKAALTLDEKLPDRR